ncbi:MAG TPA: D-aminoacyl-tRNA deacylase [Bacillota bacterium]|nr:D-aminoacyl-tRNA deacylase [Bacillota bacterium]
MRVVLQRAKNARVLVDEEVVGEIDKGLVVLVGMTHDDTIDDLKYMVNKLINLRIFEDDQGKMNLSLKDVSGSILSISQFTLYGDTRKGRRPNFMQAARPEQANKLYETFNQMIRDEGIDVATGQFGAMMQVELTNDGPVTLMIDTDE